MVEGSADMVSLMWIMFGGCVLAFIILFIDTENENDDPFRCTSGSHNFVSLDFHGRVCSKCGLVGYRTMNDATAGWDWHHSGYTDDPEAMIKRWREAEKRERLQKQKKREDYVKRIKNTKIN